MDFNQLFELGASLIRDNSDDATTGLDPEAISGALSRVLGDGEGIDLSGLVERFTGNGLGDLVQSWLGEGENAPVDPETVESVLGGDRISAFAEELGIGTESARQALADALPAIVDRATPAGSDTLATLLEQVGGLEGAVGMLGKMFGRG